MGKKCTLYKGKYGTRNWTKESVSQTTAIDNPLTSSDCSKALSLANLCKYLEYWLLSMLSINFVRTAHCEPTNEKQARFCLIERSTCDQTGHPSGKRVSLARSSSLFDRSDMFHLWIDKSAISVLT